ncbi:MAG: ATP-binding protein [Acidobacteriaceae bacterium]
MITKLPRSRRAAIRHLTDDATTLTPPLKLAYRASLEAMIPAPSPVNGKHDTGPSRHGKHPIVGNCEMSELVRGFDWSTTPLGPVTAWSETLLASVNLFLGSRFPMCLCWGEGLTTLYNDAYKPFLTNKHPASLGQPAKTVWKEAWHLIEAEFNDIFAGGPATFGKDVLMPVEKDGLLQDCFWTYSRSPIYENGRVAGLLVVRLDTTETMKALRLSEGHLCMALAVSQGVGTWNWDVVNDRCTSAPNVALLFGVDPAKAAAGVPLAEFTAAIHPSDRERIEQAIDNAVKSGQNYAVEYRLSHPDGAVRWVSARGRCVQDAYGAGVRFAGVVLDITERKLTEAALRQSEKLAAVGRMASSIAHEINNPLESVTNLLYLARNSTELHEIYEFLDTAERELRRASAVTNQTLRFHRQSTQPTSVTCLDLIASALSLYQGRLINSDIAVEKRKRAGCPIMCFEGEIRQVLSNLIGNAIDAMHDTGSGGRLLLRSREATDWKTGRKGLVVTVADTGPGMSAETIKRIFEPFFTTKGIGGNGLGLWISQEIIERHEGVLALRSSQSKARHGTVFALFLPFTAAAR